MGTEVHCYPQPSSKFHPLLIKLTENNNWSVDNNDTTLTVSLYQTHYGIAPRDVNDAWKSCQRPCRKVGITDGQDVNAAASVDVVTIYMLGS
jgi:hypothetical protein